MEVCKKPRQTKFLNQIIEKSTCIKELSQLRWLISLTTNVMIPLINEYYTLVNKKCNFNL